LSKKNRLVRRETAVMESRQEFFSGPLPPPEKLEHYDRIVPGLAERIVGLTERQSAHRQQLERENLHENIRAARTGQWMAYSLGLLALVGGFVLLALGRDAPGIVSIVSAVGGLASVFFLGRRAQRKEREEKRRRAFPEGRQGN